MSSTHIEQFRAAIEAMQAQREADKAQAHDEASHAAEALWAQAAPAKPLAQNEPKAAPTLADFAAWLTTSQQRALDAMNATTGDTFGQHCDHFIALTAAINVLSEFQQVAALQSSAT